MHQELAIVCKLWHFKLLERYDVLHCTTVATLCIAGYIYWAYDWYSVASLWKNNNWCELWYLILSKIYEVVIIIDLFSENCSYTSLHCSTCSQTLWIFLTCSCTQLLSSSFAFTPNFKVLQSCVVAFLNILPTDASPGHVVQSAGLVSFLQLLHWTRRCCETLLFKVALNYSPMHRSHSK